VTVQSLIPMIGSLIKCKLLNSHDLRWTPLSLLLSNHVTFINKKVFMSTPQRKKINHKQIKDKVQYGRDSQAT